MTWKRWAPWAGAFLLIFAMTGCISGDDLEEGDPSEGETEETVEEVPQPEPNDPVSGANNGCLDYQTLYQVAGVDSPVADVFDVEEGTGWEASGDGDSVHVEFFDSAGTWVDHGDDSGTVPEGASYGIACTVGGDDTILLTGEWTYQDGF